MSNEKNIVPYRFTSDQDRDRARENGRKGGRASGRSRRQRRRMAEMASDMLSSPLPVGSRPYEEARALYPDLGDEDMTMQLTVLQGQVRAALSGDTRAAEFLLALQDRDGDGGGEPESFVADFGLLVGPAFMAPHRAIAAGTVTDIWADGGRGSLKSSWASLEIAYGLMRDRDANALVMQARGVDIRDSTFAQVLWALEMLGVRDRWRAASSARRITSKETGQVILFRGCDDPAKTKGIKLDHGRIAFLWLEEVDQFRGMGELRTIRQSVTRGEGHMVRIHTFNPPRTRDNWANVEADRVGASDDPSEMRVTSTYLDAPREWLGEQFIRDAEGLREADETAYRHEYLGEPVGVGGEVFPRAAYEPIADELIARFDRLCAGQDWGWWPDPWAFVLSAWDPSTRTLYSFMELGGNRIQPDESAEMIRSALTWADGPGREPEFHDVPVRTDDSAPSLISAHRDAGLSAVKADKGMRRMESYEWLASVRWAIDPERCPNLAREARAKAYERTSDGKWLNSIPDGDDHWLDAVRYSVMPIVTRRGAYGTDRRSR